MSIQFKCPHCKADIQVEKRLAGQFSTCSECERPIEIPELEWATENGDTTETVGVDSVKSERHLKITLTRNSMEILTALAGLIGFLSTLRAEPGVAAWSHYTGLLMFCLASAAFAARKVGKKWVWVVGVPAIAIVMVTWASFDSYRIDRTSRTSTATGELTISDYYSRITNLPYYRKMWLRYDRGGGTYMAGPLTEAETLHGLWYQYTSGSPPTSEYLWYWYGEEITEADWNLRNK